MIIKADLHIHSCLSPCASLEMSPKNIIQEALKKNINLIAITDHNSARNCQTLLKLCNEKINCFFGMEITSIEEIHFIVLFDNLMNISEMEKIIYENLPDIKNVPEKMGDQVYVDENDYIIGEVDKYLGSPTNLSVDELINLTHELNGIIIPAHIDKPSFSLYSHLGYIPNLNWDALEVTKFYKSKENILRNINNYPLITSSDAHYIEDIGKNCIELEIDKISIQSFKNSLVNNKIRLIFN